MIHSNTITPELTTAGGYISDSVTRVEPSQPYKGALSKVRKWTPMKQLSNEMPSMKKEGVKCSVGITGGVCHSTNDEQAILDL